MKEAVFSILQSRGSLHEIRVLDLFAGTGGLGIEALSRGAESAVFVDASRAAAAAIRANLDAADLEGDVLTLPVERALGQLAREGQRFGGVFLDPPYDAQAVSPTLTRLAEAGVVDERGWIVAEHGRDETPPERVGPFVQRLHRCYGDSWIALFSSEGAAETAHGNPE